MKRLLVFGATGATGLQVVSQALEQGYDVTAFVRNPDKLTQRSDRLRQVVGNTENAEAVTRAVPGHDIVISALGVGQSFKPDGLIERSMRNVVTAMEAAGVRRLIWQSAFGVSGTRRDVPLVPRIFMATLLRRIYADKKAGEDFLRQHALDWTLVCPTGLTNSAGAGRYRAGERLTLRGVPTISRSDVAAFMLTQIEDRTYVNKEVLVSS